ncbi:MAG: diguanylate cyclase [Acidimicrobiales bacterium]
MVLPVAPDLSARLAAAGASAEVDAEVAIQRARGWCLVLALVQTALYPGQFWYLAWGAMALLVLNWIWVRWALAADDGPRIRAVGAVAMSTDTLAVIMVMSNLMDSPDDPIQLLPLALAVEAAVRWAKPGGIVGGVAGGLLMTGWSWATHVRNHVELSVGYAAFRFGVVALIGAIVGSAIAEMRQQRRAAEAVFQASRDLMATLSLDGRLVAANPACSEVLGYSVDELLEADRPFLHDPDAPAADQDLRSIVREGAERVVRRVQHREGHPVWIELDLVADPQAGLVYAIGRDVSDRSRIESELRHRVDHDGLTGAEPALPRGVPAPHAHPGLPAGPRVHRPRPVQGDQRPPRPPRRRRRDHRARRPPEHRGGPRGLGGRYAGDEFCIVVDDPDDLDLVAERTRACFEAPFDVGVSTLRVDGSVGTALGRSGDTPESLVHRADQAMYQLKKEGRLTS